MRRALKYILNIVISFYLMQIIDQSTLTTELQKVLVFMYFLVANGIIFIYLDKNVINRIKGNYFIIVLLSMLISGGIVGVSYSKIIPKDYSDYTLELKTLHQRNQQSQGYEVWVKEIRCNEQVLDLSTLTYNNGFRYDPSSRCLIADGSAVDGELQLYVHGNDNLKIVLGKHAWSGKVLINTSGESETVDLFNKGNTDYIYTPHASVVTRSNFYNCYMIVSAICCFTLYISYILSYIGYKKGILKRKQNVKIEKEKINNEPTLEVLKKFMKKYRVVIVFIAVLLIRFLYFQCNINAYLYPDSYGYIGFDFSRFLGLDFSVGRTPVYPAIIRGFKVVFGDGLYLNYVCYFQFIVSFVATVYFYKTLCLVGRRRGFALALTFLLGVSNAFCGYDNVILTESLALSGTVFVIYLLVKYLKFNSKRDGLCLLVLTFVLTFLRPTFLLFYVIIMCFLLLYYFVSKRSAILKLFFTSFIGVFLIIIYASIFYQSNGIFTISDPMPRQLLMITLDRGYYQNGDDIEYKQFLNDEMSIEEKDLWDIVGKSLVKFGLSRTQDYAKECIMNSLPEYILDMTKIVLYNSNNNFIGYNVPKNNDVTILNGLNYLVTGCFNFFKPIHALLLAFYLLFLTIYGLVVKKRVYWIACGVSCFVILIIFSSFIATCGEYVRTMIHVYPFIYLGVYYLIEFVSGNKNCISDKLVLKGDRDSLQ